MNPKIQIITLGFIGGWTHPNGSKSEQWLDPATGFRHMHLPDYLNDLNATRALLIYCGENVMDSDQWEELGRQLELAHPHALPAHPKNLEDPIDRKDYYDLATIFTISAEQICGAILKTLNKWEESE